MKKLFGTILILFGVAAFVLALTKLGSVEDSSKLVASLIVPVIPIILGLFLWQKKKEE